VTQAPPLLWFRRRSRLQRHCAASGGTRPPRAAPTHPPESQSHEDPARRCRLPHTGMDGGAPTTAAQEPCTPTLYFSTSVFLPAVETPTSSALVSNMQP